MVPTAAAYERFICNYNADDLFYDGVIVAAPYLFRYQLGIVQDDTVL